MPQSNGFLRSSRNSEFGEVFYNRIGIVKLSLGLKYGAGKSCHGFAHGGYTVDGVGVCRLCLCHIRIAVAFFKHHAFGTAHAYGDAWIFLLFKESFKVFV